MIPEIVIPEIVIPEIVIDFEVIPICANNEEVVDCEADYCLEDSCAAFPLAVGTINYCGGCSCIWTDILTGLVVDCGKRCTSHTLTCKFTFCLLKDFLELLLAFLTPTILQ